MEGTSSHVACFSKAQISSIIVILRSKSFNAFDTDLDLDLILEKKDGQEDNAIMKQVDNSMELTIGAKKKVMHSSNGHS
ncbi:unnamed protein product [Dovyalis caffra]|uniref:Uncharacterized protein n=1 Tax=Dovyalis caffra TaxID=77055 RepID=A0AAV1R202_9ROSI|nr:unnamed protein product [Dovyalis caffra]